MLMLMCFLGPLTVSHSFNSMDGSSRVLFNRILCELSIDRFHFTSDMGQSRAPRPKVDQFHKQKKVHGLGLRDH